MEHLPYLIKFHLLYIIVLLETHLQDEPSSHRIKHLRASWESDIYFARGKANGIMVA